MKRLLTIQDISCLGKCSITIALPLISAMGVETVILPTALLSTHTMFSGFTVKDLSDQLRPITAHWKKEGVTFDAIYTGYLGTEEETDTVKEIIDEFRGPETLVFVDPAMGDNGKLYPAFDISYAKKNASLCAVADVIVPNITEACFMTDTPYKSDLSENEVRALLEKLARLGAKVPVLTGVSLSEGKTGAMGYLPEEDRFFSYQHDRVPVSYHGTGDIFSSVCVGGLMNGLSFADALKLAGDYTEDTISVTLADPREPWYGVNFEETIPDLVRKLKEMKS